MGKYDNVDRDYFSVKKRFAELISVGIYHKKLTVREEELEKTEGTYPSLSNLSGKKERDGIFLCHGQKVKYGLEIENCTDYGMPHRMFTYDACDYEKQTTDLYKTHQAQKDLKSYEEIKSKMKPSDKLYPVVNMLLYLGQGHWKGGRALRDMFDVPEQYQPFLYDKIQNYSFAIIEADKVNPNDFHTDLKQFFMALQCRSDKNKLNELFERKDFQNLNLDTQHMITVHLDMKQLEKKVMEEKKEMCKAYRELIRDWKQEGFSQGINQGINQGIEATFSCIEKVKAGFSKSDLLQEGFQEDIIDRALKLV